MPGITVEAYRPEDAEAALAVINDAFGFERSSDWFAWKHLNGPWGPSSGAIASDDDGPVGVRLLLPWLFLLGSTEVLAYRAVEAATVPRARGQGVFSALNRSLMEQVASREEPTFIYSTPNEMSRDGYRKLGWTWLEPVRHEYRLAPIGCVPRRGATRLEGRAALTTFALRQSPYERIRTSWDPAALRWRFDQRSGNRYRALALRSSEGTGGIVYRRIVTRRIPTLLPLLTWGRAELVHGATAIVARDEQTPIMLDVHEPMRGLKLGIQRGDSLLSVWAPDQRWIHDHRVGEVNSWAVSFADLESVL